MKSILKRLLYGDVGGGGDGAGLGCTANGANDVGIL